MLRLKKISDLMRMAADTIDDHHKKTNGVPSAATEKLIKDLRDLSREILTSQEYQNSKIKL